MRGHVVVVCLVGVGLLLSAGVATGSAQQGNTPYVPGQVLVKFHPGTPASEIARAHASLNSVILDEIPQIGVQIVGLPPGLSVNRAVGLYRHNPNVEFAEPDYVVELALTPNDPYYHYGQLELQWMGAERAWDIATGSGSVLIAVLDTGADFSHPDLQGRLVAGWDFVDNDSNPADLHGHGTNVTGVLGATTDNSLGVAGVSWRNPVLIVRIGDANGIVTSSRIAQGITYAADQGARAINLSCGGPAYSAAEENAVTYAWGKDAVTVGAAGNSSRSDPCYPAALPHALAVSGVDDHDLLVAYSNYGTWIDVCAPCNAQTTHPGGTIALWGGTSISAPYVTGLFGLVFSANPSLTAQQAVDIVEQNTDDLGDPGFDIYYGWGKINLFQAVLAAAQAADSGDTTAPTASVTAPPGGATLTGTADVTAAATDNVGVTKVELYIDDALEGWVAITPYSWTWDTTSHADGSHRLLVKAYDAAGNLGASPAVSVDLQNSPVPDVTETFTGTVNSARGPISRDHTISLSAPGAISASLAWGGKTDLNLYLYSPAGGLVASSAAAGRTGSEQISYQAPGAGTYTLRVTMASGKASYTLTVTHP